MVSEIAEGPLYGFQVRSVLLFAQANPELSWSVPLFIPKKCQRSTAMGLCTLLPTVAYIMASVVLDLSVWLSSH